WPDRSGDTPSSGAVRGSTVAEGLCRRTSRVNKGRPAPTARADGLKGCHLTPHSNESNSSPRNGTLTPLAASAREAPSFCWHSRSSIRILDSQALCHFVEAVGRQSQRARG